MAVAATAVLNDSVGELSYDSVVPVSIGTLTGNIGITVPNLGTSVLNSGTITSSSAIRFSHPSGTSGIINDDRFNLLSGFIGESITQTTISNMQNVLNRHYSGTGGIGTAYITITGADCQVSIVGDNISGSAVCWPKPDIKHIMKDMFKQRLLIKVNSRQEILGKASVEEERARATLRDMLTEQDWRRYITNGFIVVKGGTSDYWYQIFRNKGLNVYHKGKLVNYICIHTDQNCPPTDHVINMKLLVELDEMAVWQNGNIREVSMNTNSSYVRGTNVDSFINQNITAYYQRLKAKPQKLLTYTCSLSDSFALAC